MQKLLKVPWGSKWRAMLASLIMTGLHFSPGCQGSMRWNGGSGLESRIFTHVNGVVMRWSNLYSLKTTPSLSANESWNSSQDTFKNRQRGFRAKCAWKKSGNVWGIVSFILTDSLSIFECGGAGVQVLNKRLRKPGRPRDHARDRQDNLEVSGSTYLVVRYPPLYWKRGWFSLPGESLFFDEKKLPEDNN